MLAWAMPSRDVIAENKKSNWEQLLSDFLEQRGQSHACMGYAESRRDSRKQEK